MWRRLLTLYALDCAWLLSSKAIQYSWNFISRIWDECNQAALINSLVLSSNDAGILSLFVCVKGTAAYASLHVIFFSLLCFSFLFFSLFLFYIFLSVIWGLSILTTYFFHLFFSLKKILSVFFIFFFFILAASDVIQLVFWHHITHSDFIMFGRESKESIAFCILTDSSTWEDGVQQWKTGLLSLWADKKNWLTGDILQGHWWLL